MIIIKLTERVGAGGGGLVVRTGVAAAAAASTPRRISTRLINT